MTVAGFACVECIDCGAGLRENVTCNVSTATQRSCQLVEPGYASAAGENGQEQCEAGVTYSAGFGAASCALCDSCGAGERQATECTATANRTCAAVDKDFYSAEGDNAQRKCFNVECPSGTWRSGTSCDSDYIRRLHLGARHNLPGRKLLH